MANKQFKTYCRIIDYIEAVDAPLASLLKGLCADLSLSSLKGKPGITFLYPTDKAFRDKLEKLAYSDDPNQAMQASDMISMLIIRDVFRNPGEWKSREVSNSLYPSQIVEVEGANATSVQFKGGAKATLDTAFKDSSRKQNLAVWKLEGELIKSNKQAAPPQKKTIRGSYDPGRLVDQSTRFRIALAVENAYALHRVQCCIGNVSADKMDPYKKAVNSLIHYILVIKKDNDTFRNKIVPILAHDKMDFYILVEPHKLTGPYLIDDYDISEWWKQQASYRCNCRAIYAAIEAELTRKSDDCLFYSDRPRLIKLIDDARIKLRSVIPSQPRNAVAQIESAYKELETSNTINGEGPVFPSDLFQYYSSNLKLKMLHDDLRYVTYGSFCALENIEFNYQDFHEITNTIGECMRNYSEPNAPINKLLNPVLLRYMISPSELVSEIMTFVMSTVFMHISLTATECSQLKVKSSVTKPDPSAIAVFNISKDLAVKHKRIIDFEASRGTVSVDDLVEALAKLDKNTLDPRLRQVVEMLSK